MMPVMSTHLGIQGASSPILLLSKQEVIDMRPPCSAGLSPNLSIIWVSPTSLFLSVS